LRRRALEGERGSRRHPPNVTRVVRRVCLPIILTGFTAYHLGIISALAFSTDYSGLYAAGSFGGSVSLYQEDHDGSVGHLDGVEPGGITQVSPLEVLWILVTLISYNFTRYPLITYSYLLAGQMSSRSTMYATPRLQSTSCRGQGTRINGYCSTSILGADTWGQEMK
jgi:hypothetical protein